MKAFCPSAALAAILLLAKNAHADVIVVDASVDGPLLLPVIQAAHDGDTILLKPGTYYGLIVDGKSLTIVGDVGAIPRVGGGASVLNLAVGQTVLLERLGIDGAYGDYDPPEPEKTGIYIHDNSGPVRIQSCNLYGGFAMTDPWCGCWEGASCNGGIGAMIVANPAGVAFQDCLIFGGSSAGAFDCSCEQSGGASSKNGETALYVQDTLVAAYDCLIIGGTGGPGCDHGGDGGAGARASLSTRLTGLVLSGTTIRGGRGGGDTDIGHCANGGDGGDGMIVDPGVAVWRLDTTLTGGLGFHGYISAGTDGTALVNSGEVFDFPQPRLNLEVPSPLREGELATATVRGRPGDDVYLYFGTETVFRPLTAWHGVLLTRAPRPWFVGILGTIPASGVLSGGFQVPDLDPSMTARTWYVQAWRNSPTDGRTFGSMRAVTILDSAY